MDKQDFISIYKRDTTIKGVSDALIQDQSNLKLDGLAGSSDALICSVVHQTIKKCFLVILHDKEEATYFLDDLLNLTIDSVCKLFPTSYKKPYQFEDIENANILQRAEVLNLVNQDT